MIVLFHLIRWLVCDLLVPLFLRNALLLRNLFLDHDLALIRGVFLHRAPSIDHFLKKALPFRQYPMPSPPKDYPYPNRRENRERKKRVLLDLRSLLFSFRYFRLLGDSVINQSSFGVNRIPFIKLRVHEASNL